MAQGSRYVLERFRVPSLCSPRANVIISHTAFRGHPLHNFGLESCWERRQRGCKWQTRALARVAVPTLVAFAFSLFSRFGGTPGLRRPSWGLVSSPSLVHPCLVACPTSPSSPSPPSFVLPRVLGSRPPSAYVSFSYVLWCLCSLPLYIKFSLFHTFSTSISIHPCSLFTKYSIEIKVPTA